MTSAANAAGGVSTPAAPPSVDASTQDNPTAIGPMVVDASATVAPCQQSQRDDVDLDGDGFTRAQGDCDECVAAINPGAFDFPGDMFDEDCSGTPAMGEEACEDKLAIDSKSAEDAARALGLCKFVTEESKAWGVISARFTDASGKGEISDPLAVGLVPDFGTIKPLAGSRMLLLSSGVARTPSQPGYTNDCDEFDEGCGLNFNCQRGATPPMGYPKDSSSCKSNSPFARSTMNRIFNQAALELKVRVPSNASAFTFDSNFFTYEYPDFICEMWNDFFVAFKEPKPPGVSDGNILFDSNGDSIGVNTALLQVCDPALQSRQAGKKFDCPLGTKMLKGTGYGPDETTCYQGGGAATGWLHTTAPVGKGEIMTLRFAIWDTNDAILDSTAVIDHFTWMGKSDIEVKTSTVPLF